MDRAKDWKKFVGLIGLLDESFNRESSKLRVDIYFKTLEQFTIEAIEKAVYQTIGIEKFYPLPATLIEIIKGGSADDRAMIAWGKVVETIRISGYYHSVKFDDPAIHLVIESGWGNWMNLCTNLKESELNFVSNTFRRLYVAYTDRPDLLKQAPSHLEGFFEVDCSAKGLKDYIPKPTLIVTKPKELEEPEEKKEIGSDFS